MPAGCGQPFPRDPPPELQNAMRDKGQLPEQATALDEALRMTRRGFYAVMAFSCAVNLLMLVVPLYMLQVYDRVLASGEKATLFFLTLIALVALVVLGALDALRQIVLSRMGSWLQRHMSNVVIRSSMRGALAGGATSAQGLRDLAQVQSFVGGQGIMPLFDGPWVPVFLVVMFLLHPWIGVFATFAAVVLFCFALANELATRKRLREANQKNVAALGHAEAAVRNAEVIEAMGMDRAILERWTRLNDASAADQSRAAEIGASLLGTTKFLRLFFQVSILGLGAYLVLLGEMTAGAMIAGSILLGRALAPVEQSIGMWRNFVAARTSWTRLQGALRLFGNEVEPMPLPPPQGRIMAEAVSFVPPNSKRVVLRNVSFELAPGESLAVIGPSAAGKSTLCRLLVGVWQPSHGHIRLDAAEIAAWNQDQRNAYIGYLPQDVELFQGSVRENIARMTEGDPAAVVEAAKLADIHEMILRLPEGYDTQIGPQGAVLSGGQRQRIGLARAVYGGPRILVLDEPNASLDNEGELALQRTIKDVKEHGTTVVMVAHRPSALVHVDKLLVLQDGQVAMFGPRDEVLEQLNKPRAVPLKRPEGQAQQAQGGPRPAGAGDSAGRSA